LNSVALSALNCILRCNQTLYGKYEIIIAAYLFWKNLPLPKLSGSTIVTANVAYYFVFDFQSYSFVIFDIGIQILNASIGWRWKF